MRKHSILALMVLGLATACSRDVREPGLEIPILTDMAHPVPVEAFTTAMRTPVPGTVSREKRWESPDGIHHPLKSTTEYLARGQFVYENYCLVCHGKTGDGDGPLIPKFPNPPPFSSRRVMALSSVELFGVVRDGKGQMGSYAAQISAEDRWKVVLYIEKLQGKPGENVPEGKN